MMVAESEMASKMFIAGSFVEFVYKLVVACCGDAVNCNGRLLKSGAGVLTNRL
jgi:hypothetical protein